MTPSLATADVVAVVQPRPMPSPRRPYVRLGTKAIGPRARLLAEQIAEGHGFSLSALQSSGRREDRTIARQEIMWTLRQEGYSESQIGLLLGRDASTVSHGARRHSERISTGVANGQD